MYDYGPQMDLYAEIARFRLACQLFGNRKKARKARKGKKFFVGLLMSSLRYSLKPSLSNLGYSQDRRRCEWSWTFWTLHVWLGELRKGWRYQRHGSPVPRFCLHFSFNCIKVICIPVLASIYSSTKDAYNYATKLHIQCLTTIWDIGIIKVNHKNSIDTKTPASRSPPKNTLVHAVVAIDICLNGNDERSW